jgi:hypothetical protein
LKPRPGEPLGLGEPPRRRASLKRRPSTVFSLGLSGPETPKHSSVGLVREWRVLAGRAWQRADLLQHPRDVAHRPVFDDLFVLDAVDRDAFGLDVLVCRGDPH